MEHHLSNGGEAKVARPDDPGVNGSDGDLDDALTMEMVKPVLRAINPWNRRCGVEILAQGVDALGPIIV